MPLLSRTGNSSSYVMAGWLRSLALVTWCQSKLRFKLHGRHHCPTLTPNAFTGAQMGCVHCLLLICHAQHQQIAVETPQASAPPIYHRRQSDQFSAPPPRGIHPPWSALEREEETDDVCILKEADDEEQGGIIRRQSQCQFRRVPG